MTGGSIRLGRSVAFRLLALALVALAGVTGAAWLASPAHAQQAVPPEAAASEPAGESIQARIEQVLRNQQTLSSAEVQTELAQLLQGDLSGVLPQMQLAGFHALATAHERLAQDARKDKTEEEVQQQIDRAVTAYLRVGQLATQLGDHVTAEQAYNRILNYRPNAPEALLGMARLYAAWGGRHYQAIERYQEYFKASRPPTPEGSRPSLVVGEPGLYVEMGRVYASANLWNQALKSYRTAASNGVDTDELAALLASCHLALGQTAQAFEQAEKAIDKSRGAQPAYYRLYAELLLGRGEVDKAREQATKGVEAARRQLATAPDRQKTLTVLQECLAVYSRTLEGVLARNPADLEARLAIVQALRGQIEVAEVLTAYRALEILRAAPSENSRDVNLLEAQIRLQAFTDHPDLRATCERLLELDAQNALARQTLDVLNGAGQAPTTAAAADGANGSADK